MKNKIALELLKIAKDLQSADTYSNQQNIKSSPRYIEEFSKKTLKYIKNLSEDLALLDKEMTNQRAEVAKFTAENVSSALSETIKFSTILKKTIDELISDINKDTRIS